MTGVFFVLCAYLCTHHPGASRAGDRLQPDERARISRDQHGGSGGNGGDRSVPAGDRVLRLLDHLREYRQLPQSDHVAQKSSSSCRPTLTGTWRL